jgi:hypothetical protein
MRDDTDCHMLDPVVDIKCCAQTRTFYRACTRMGGPYGLRFPPFDAGRRRKESIHHALDENFCKAFD